MAVIKIVQNPIDTYEALYNVCNYITRPDKTENGRYVGARGMDTNKAYEEIVEMQAIFNKTDGRKGYHMIVSFSEGSPLSADDIFQIANEISYIFFPTYQVVFGLNMVEGHPHIHFFINIVSLYDGKKLHIGFSELKLLRSLINQIESNFLEF